MSIEAMKQALEALEAEAAGWDSVSPVTRDAIIALLAAIEEAEKPWVKTSSEGRPVYTTPEEQLEPVAWFTVDEINEWAVKYLEKHPDQKPRQWQGLTEEEIARREIVNPIRVRIMQEAYDLADRDDSEGYNSVKVMCSEVLGMIDRLLDERQWQGLTDEDLDIRALWDVLAGMNNADGSIVVQFARAIEAKLKEKNT